MPDVKRVLLIDDDEDFVLLLKTAFDFSGFGGDFASALNADEGMAALRGKGCEPLPDLVLLDMHLPGMTGFELLRWIRRRPELIRARVIILTGIEAEGDSRRATELGAQEFIVKPLGFSRLLELSEQMLGPGFAAPLAGHQR